MNEKTAVLDLTNCEHWDELHSRIKKALGFPQHYGNNWDAFWDCINRDCDICFLIVLGTSKIADELIPEIQTMKELLEKNRQRWKNSNCPFNYRLVD